MTAIVRRGTEFVDVFVEHLSLLACSEKMIREEAVRQPLNSTERSEILTFVSLGMKSLLLLTNIFGAAAELKAAVSGSFLQMCVRILSQDRWSNKPGTKPVERADTPEKMRTLGHFVDHQQRGQQAPIVAGWLQRCLPEGSTIA